jgi:hypothetical protein
MRAQTLSGDEPGSGKLANASAPDSPELSVDESPGRAPGRFAPAFPGERVDDFGADNELEPDDEPAVAELEPDDEPVEDELEPDDEPVEPPEPVVSANAVGIQAVTAAPMPNATASAPTRPTYLDESILVFGMACFGFAPLGFADFRTPSTARSCFTNNTLPLAIDSVANMDERRPANKATVRAKLAR